MLKIKFKKKFARGYFSDSRFLYLTYMYVLNSILRLCVCTRTVHNTFGTLCTTLTYLHIATVYLSTSSTLCSYIMYIHFHKHAFVLIISVHSSHNCSVATINVKI